MDTDRCGRLLPRRELASALPPAPRRIDTASLFPDAAAYVPSRVRKLEAAAQVRPQRERRRWLRRRMAEKALHLHVIEITNGFVIDARHHIFKQNERFLLELDQRIFLSVAAEADAFLQVIER